MAKAQKKSSPLFLHIIILAAGLGIGFFAGKSTASKKQINNLDTQTIQASKTEIIKEIILTNEVSNFIFTERILPEIESRFASNNLFWNEIKKANFKDDLRKEKFNELHAIDEKYRMSFIDFYDQFSTAELLVYLNYKKSPENVKIQRALDESMPIYVKQWKILMDQTTDVLNSYLTAKTLDKNMNEQKPSPPVLEEQAKDNN